MVFQQKLLEKSYFTAKMSGLAMVRPACSDFWKVPLSKTTTVGSLALSVRLSPEIIEVSISLSLKRVTEKTDGRMSVSNYKPGSSCSKGE